MAERKFTTMFFLVSLLVFLSIMITLWAYNIYMEKASYATSSSTNLVKCSSYSFKIEEIKYSENSLVFNIENIMGDEFSQLIVEGVTSKNITLDNFKSGIALRITVNDINISKEFLAYPKGCKDTNARKYKI